MSRKKLETGKQIIGKVETFQPTTLDQIWGDDGFSKYKTMEESEYMGMLAELNMSDLRTHATKVGVVPSEDRDRLVKRLVGQFRTHVSAYKMAKVKPSAPKSPSKDVLKILAEGR